MLQLAPSPILQTTNTMNSILAPNFVRPFPKVALRKENRCGRKKRKSAVLTDTPEKDALEKEETNRLLKVKPKPAKHRLDTRQKIKRKVLQERSDWFCLVCLRLIRAVKQESLG